MKQQVKKPRKAVVGENAPWLPPHYDIADASAIQALQRGEATFEQQQRALKWIIENACKTYDMPYRPGGDEGRRDTDFALGRQFVGQQIVKLLKLNLSIMRTRDV